MDNSYILFAVGQFGFMLFFSGMMYRTYKKERPQENTQAAVNTDFFMDGIFTFLKYSIIFTVGLLVIFLSYGG